MKNIYNITKYEKEKKQSDYFLTCLYEESL